MFCQSRSKNYLRANMPEVISQASAETRIDIIAVEEVEKVPLTKALQLERARSAVHQALSIANTRSVPVAVVPPMPTVPGSQRAVSVAVYTTTGIMPESAEQAKSDEELLTSPISDSAGKRPKWSGFVERISDNNFLIHPEGLYTRCELRRNLISKLYVDRTPQLPVKVIKFLVPPTAFSVHFILTLVGINLDETKTTLTCEELPNIAEGDVIVTVRPVTT